MKEYGDPRFLEIKSNAEEFGRRLRKLARLSPEAASYIFNKIAFGFFRDLVERTPVDTGRLRHGWEIKKVNDFFYQISNPTEYILFVEFGVKGHPLSDDPIKRKKSLRYLFAKGILESVKVEAGGFQIIYHYTPKEQKTGFIRNTIKEWTEKAPKLIRQYLKEFIIKTMQGR
jgi:hypothetical protein